jgi:hypothetical protein
MDYPGKVITKTQVTPTQTSASGNWTLDDQAAAIKNNNWPIAGVPNPIFKSLRFNSADTAYLNRTPASAGNRKKWTWSGWVKKSTIGNFEQLMAAAIVAGTSEEQLCFGFPTADGLSYRDGVSGNYTVTAAIFRDPSAWYHIVFVYDSANAAQADRGIFYVNGIRQTATTNAIPLNRDSYINSTTVQALGRFGAIASSYFNGYMTEMNFVDGQALTPSDVGLTNPQTGQWIPKKYTGTYGTNGFYLNFKDATSTTTLGYDYSGNANNWATTGFSVTAGTGNDSLTDVPTPWFAYNTTGDVGGVFRGNYCTLNPIVTGNVITPLNGNLNTSLATGANAYFNTVGTTAISSGKWYWECTVTARDAGAGQWMQFGIVATTTTYTSNALGLSGNMSNGYAYYNDGSKGGQGTSTAGYGATFTNNDVIGVALDLDAGTITFYKNGVSQGQAFSGISLTAAWLPIIQIYRSTGTTQSAFINFGQRPFEKWNGSAYVANTPPAGFRSLCTTNLPPPTIGFGLTNQANQYFDVTTYTGNGAVRSITNSGSMQPDFVWDKLRSGANSHRLFDAVRGVEKALYSNLTNIVATETGTITAFNSNGFSLGTNNETNTNGSTYVAWQWNAGGSNQTISVGQYSTSPNVPSIASTVRANTTSGFSIVTGTLGAAGVQSTVGHGLNAVPNMILFKTRSGATYNWSVFHTSIATDTTKYLRLNDTSATLTYSTVWGAALPTTTVFGVTGDGCGSPSNPFVAYCFAAVPGYSAFGSYTGNGSTDGPFVYTGFRPRYVLIKRTDAVDNWAIFDTSRLGYNADNNELLANTSSAEGTADFIDILSNGFKNRNSDGRCNASGGTYIYAAFAESPFQFANAR